MCVPFAGRAFTPSSPPLAAKQPPPPRWIPTTTTTQADLQCLQPEADGGEVRLTVFAPAPQSSGNKASSCRPLVAALVRMPLSEPDLADAVAVL
jgi:hypothetical protein